jgi:pimeloyl-ACP methyl ester carboxylesterase
VQTVYVIPGFAGSEMFLDAGLTQKLWVSYGQIALGSVGGLRLASDGISPGPPDGVPCYPGGPLPDYYGAAIGNLQNSMFRYNYAVVGHGYDWRMTSVKTGQLLADRIRSEVDPALPCTLVAHSFGGIVARMAWSNLQGSGQQALVRRIITIGTPHYGSYGIVRLWSEDAESSRQIATLSLVAAAFYGPLAAVELGKIWTSQRVAALSATWPSCYEILPSLLAPDAANDPLRPALFMGDWPVDLEVSRKFLDNAVNVIQPLLAGSAALPPLAVLTTVAGTGYSTVDTLVQSQPLGSSGIYAAHDSGDGQVAEASALLPLSVQYSLQGAHGDLPVITAGLSQAVAAILDERTSTPPAPPLVGVAGFTSFMLHGPPFTELSNAGVDP